jgi:hypothetical protein
MRYLLFAYLLLLSAMLRAQMVAPASYGQIQGWTLLSDSYEDALVTLNAAREFNINHLQLSHHIVMDLCEVKDTARQRMVNLLTSQAHQRGIKEVVVWDHAFYKLDYYPDVFKTGPGNTINLDNTAFWDWFKQDYREMLNRIPGVDGLVLTFIETGARAENQYSQQLKTGPEKLAAVVDAVADVVCKEYGKKLYVRTFAYTDDEYDNTIGCINHVKSRDIILMMKETPHDFFLTHPNDKYAGTIDRPTIIEFDTGNEFNGQGIIANTWPGYIINRISDYAKRPNIVGYVARTDRYGNTRLVGTPNEILLYTLKRYMEDSTRTADDIYNEFIAAKYGEKAIPYVKPAFEKAFDIVTSSLYTLGTNTANHSALNYDPYKSSYGRHVSGKWINPPVVFIKHGVNKQFHYWKDIIEQLAPAHLKRADGPLKREAPYVLDSGWVTDKECMTASFLKEVMKEKQYGVKSARQALDCIRHGEKVLSAEDYRTLYSLFERTLYTAQLHEAVATAYWGYRVYSRRNEINASRIKKKTILAALTRLDKAIRAIESFKEPTPTGQWNWKEDVKMARSYYQQIIKKLPIPVYYRVAEQEQ